MSVLMILPDGPEAHLKAAAIIRAGQVVAFRTDTFYGLGVDPQNPAAVNRLNELKGREGKPILLVVAATADVDRFVAHRSALFDRVAAEFWPGPLTLVAKARAELPEPLTAGTGTIGVRLPVDANVRELVRLCGGALTATSANISGSPPARNAKEVVDQFPTGVELVIDSGEVNATEPSSVLDVSGDEPRLIREGAVSWEALGQSISEISRG